MTECHDDTVETDLKPPAARFYGWRVVWIGAFILAIGSYEQGLPQLLRFTLGEVVVRRGSHLCGGSRAADRFVAVVVDAIGWVGG